LGTVYRNLNAFAQRGDILKISVAEGGDRFDFRLDRHEHLLCNQCGRVFDAEAEVEIIIREGEVTVDGYTLILHGLCAKCNHKMG
jgi:Fur family peroxide stress response transcriptional regulator